MTNQVAWIIVIIACIEASVFTPATYPPPVINNLDKQMNLVE